MLQASGLSKSYKQQAVLDKIDLTVQSGETVCIIGKNGSGKSTLLQILATILLPDSGSLTINNIDILKNKHKGKEFIGFIPQDDTVFQDLSVWDNLIFFAGLYHVDKKTIFNEDSVATLLGLEELRKKKVKRLSGGQRKRVHIACSILHNPPILMMDEPFAGLDLLIKKDILNYLKSLQSAGKTILYTSHGSDEIFSLCHSAYVLNKGQLYNITEQINDGRDQQYEQLNDYLSAFIEGGYE